MSKKTDESLDFSALFKDARPVNHNQYVLSKDERERKHKKESSLKLAKKRLVQIWASHTATIQKTSMHKMQQV